MTFRFTSFTPLLGMALATFFVGTIPASAGVGRQGPGTPTTQQAMLISISRDRVTVRNDMVRLGDLFTNTGDKAKMIVEAAPSAGGQAVFDVYRLASIARAHGLVWQARSWSEKVVIDRASQTITSDRVLLALRQALEKKVVLDGRWDIEVAGRSDLTLTLPIDKPAAVAIENLRYNPTSGQFAAVATAYAGGPATRRLNIAGRILRMIEVPTLNRRIVTGDVITADNITWVSMRAGRVGRNVITDAEQIIGMTPTRTIVSGKVLMNGDLRAPRMVTKGSTVIMLLRTPHMLLTSKGRALEHGAKGDVIRVINTHSKTVVDGEITSSGTVRVTTAHFLALGMSGQTHGAVKARR